MKRITDDLNLYIFTNDLIKDKGNWEIRNSEHNSLGTYSTEEKAIKVLDMIQNAYTQYGTIKDELGNIHGLFDIPKCFLMPSDEKVEV